MILAVDVTSSIGHEADAHLIDLPTQSATIETMGKCVAIQEHPLLAGQIQGKLTVLMQNAFTIKNHDTENGDHYNARRSSTLP